MEQWGRDELALARRAARLAEMQAAATVLALLGVAHAGSRLTALQPARRDARRWLTFGLR